MADQVNDKTDQPADPNSNTPVEQKAFDWSKIAVALASALAGILGTPYGIYVALGVAVLGGILAFFLRGMIKDYIFKKQEADAGGKVGGDASDGQKKEDDNRDDVDGWLGRDKRT
jgi:hypothetical protein